MILMVRNKFGVLDISLHSAHEDVLTANTLLHLQKLNSEGIFYGNMYSNVREKGYCPSQRRASPKNTNV